MPTTKEMQSEALSRAQGGTSWSNYPAIIEGFMQKGIPADQIEPRVNVFTFNAWKAAGRVVRKGEHGVKIVTFVPMEKETKNAAGQLVRESFSAPRTVTVFHVSQTKPLEDRRSESAAA